jgi:hypothetical protein
MRPRTQSRGERFTALLHSPHELTDALESLGYWRDRSRRLPWYRLRARREAVEMAIRWEQRAGAAAIAQRGVPAAVRLDAGLLIVRARLSRWGRRARVAAWATFAVAATIVAVPLLAALTFLIHAL